MTKPKPNPKSKKPIVTIEGTCEGAELDKRTYLPGIIIRSVCPKCGEPWERDLSYPEVGKPVDANGFCGKCEHEWPVMVVLRLTVEPA